MGGVRCEVWGMRCEVWGGGRRAQGVRYVSDKRLKRSIFR